MNEVNALNKKSSPWGIKIISVLLIIFGIFFISWGLITIFSDLLNQGDAFFGFGFIFGPMIIVSGILPLLFGIFLWRGHNWARILIIVLASMSLLSAFPQFALLNVPVDDGGMEGNFIWLIFFFLINLILILYLVLSKRVKEFFSNKSS